jgi:helicase
VKEKEIIQKVIELNGIKKLNPLQRKAISAGLFKGENLVISSPTSSGKTLIAEIAGLNISLNFKKKMVYLCPLVALAQEKYEEFKRKYSKWGIKVALSVGDYDSSDPWLEDYDWIITSNEKMDSLIRHQAKWIKDIGLTIADEIHLLNDDSRGPTLEILLTILKTILPTFQIIALSATIKNAEEIAKWLKAKAVRSLWRPTKLYYGIAFNGKIKMFERNDYQIDPKIPIENAILKNTLEFKKQVIFFVSTRRNCEALAERLKETVKDYLTEEERRKLFELAKKIKNTLETPTLQCTRLAKCVVNGSAFFHSGLLRRQRNLIAKAYKDGILKVISSTTALAFGINLPNFRAVIRDVKRYLPGEGSIFLPVLEVQQMFGRSGRPQYDEWGEGILVAKNKMEVDRLKNHYLFGEMEEISSKIAKPSVFRMHILSLIASEFCKRKGEILNFFSQTFLAISFFEALSLLERKIKDCLDLLKEWRFIRENAGEFEATKLGRRVSRLYLDPASAHLLIEGIKNVKKKWNNFSFLHLICATGEMKPPPFLTTKDLPKIEIALETHKDSFLIPVPDIDDQEYEEFLREVKLAMVIEAWINEITESEILEEFKITPGELYSYIKTAEWLFYSVEEIGKILFLPQEIQKSVRILRTRIRYGIKEELISLVKLREIGRARARKLFNAGLKTISDLKIANINKIAKVLNSSLLAHKIKQQLQKV